MNQSYEAYKAAVERQMMWKIERVPPRWSGAWWGLKVCDAVAYFCFAWIGWNLHALLG